MDFDITKAPQEGPEIAPKGKMMLPTIGSIKRGLIRFDKELVEVKAKVEALEITDDKSATVMIETGTQTKEILKSIESAVANRVGHIKKLIQEANAIIRYYKDEVGDIQDITKLKIGKWQREQEIIRQETLRKQQEEIDKVNEALRKQAEEKNLIAPKEIIAPVVTEQKTLRTSGGAKATAVKRWVFDVVDIKELAGAVIEDNIPTTYIQVNQVIINQAIKQGIRQIPGLRIYQDESIRF